MTTFLAIWGAVLSTVAIAWNIRKDLVDQGKIKVTCYLGQLRGGDGPPDPRTHLAYRVTNVGRRPVVVTHVGGAIRKDRHFMLTTRNTLPKTLQPGEYFLEYSHDLSVLEEDPEALWVIDSFDKNWKVPRKMLRALLTEYRRSMPAR